LWDNSWAVLLAALYRLRLELQASQNELARKQAELSFALEVNALSFPDFAFWIRSGVCRRLHTGQRNQRDYYDVMELPDGKLVFAIAISAAREFPPLS